MNQANKLKTIPKLSLSGAGFVLSLVCLLLPIAASAQSDQSATANSTAQPTSAESSETQSQLPDRSRILYIDAPVPVQEGVDPILPEPALPVEVVDEVSAQRRVQVLRDYDLAIAAIERDGGAWDQALTEELSALGRVQQEQGIHAEAISTLTRAMHINRINDGLHTLAQVPVVERMIESYAAMGDWASVDLYQNYLFFVQQKAYGSDDPRIIPVLNSLGQWNIEAFGLGFGDPLGSRLSTAQLLFNAASNMVGIHFGRNDERYVPYLRNVANSAYLVALHPDYMSEIGRPEYVNEQELLRRKLNQAGSSEPRGFLAGLSALEEVVDIYRETEEEDGPVQEPYLLAEALANLADWYLIFDRFRTAEDYYGEAWQILQETEDSEELTHRLFGQVIPLPTFANSSMNLSLGSTESMEVNELLSDYADVRLNVNQNGSPRSVEILTEVTDENERQLSRLRREITRGIFRPLIVEGRIEPSEGHVFRYQYWY